MLAGGEGVWNLWPSTVPMSLFKQRPFFPASYLDQVLITQERPKQRHFKQRHKARIVSHGNFGFPAELLFSKCCLYTITVPLLRSLPCREVSSPGLSQPGWPIGGWGAKLCPVPAPLCSLLHPAQAKGSCCPQLLQACWREPGLVLLSLFVRTFKYQS